MTRRGSDPRGTPAQHRARMAALAAVGRTVSQVLARNLTPKDEFAAHVRKVGK